MKIDDLSVCYTTDKVSECKDFYIKYFNAQLTFDCDWYIVIKLGDGENNFISFMNPQNNERLYQGGTTLNIKVSDVDSHYTVLSNMDIQILSPIIDQPWGDRSFRVLDPLGTTVYIYSDREPNEEYKAACK